MENEVILPKLGISWRFFASAIFTVLVGVGMGLAGIVLLRPPAVVSMEPEVRVVKVPGEPKVEIREVIKVVEKIVTVEKPAALIPVQQPYTWEGIWRPKTSELPMFKLQEAKGGISGKYAASTGRVLPFQGGRIVGNAVEIVVDDSLFRVHFRLEKVDEMSLKVTAWITDDDWLVSLERGNKQVTTLDEAVLVRAQLKANEKLTRKHEVVGVFYRGTGG